MRLLASGTSRKITTVFLQAVLLILTSGTYTVIIVIALSTTWALRSDREAAALSSWLKVEVGTTITVMRVLQGLLSAFSSVLLNRFLLYLKWGLVNRPNGTSFQTALAVSPTTLDLGTLRLAFGLGSRWTSRLWAVMRLSLVALVWISGMLLFFRTSLVTVYDTASEFEATAGVGPFQASYVQGFLDTLAETAPGYPFNIVPYTFYGIVYNLITNPLFTTVADPLQCKPSKYSRDCAAFVLSGGLSLVTPFNPSGHPEYSLVRVSDIPTVQMDFESEKILPPGFSFEEKDCDVFSSNDTIIAVEFCVASLPSGSIAAGILVCESISSDGACETASPAQNISTVLTFHSRTATMLTSRTNLTVLDISDLGDPQLIRFSESDIRGYRLALSWLLDYSRADIPAPSAIVEMFWSARDGLAESGVDGVLSQTLRSILAFPVWLFNANNWGNSGGFLSSGEVDGVVPDEFHRTARIVEPHVKLKFDPVILVLFIVFQGAVLAFLWATWAWWVWVGVLKGRQKNIPVLSSYPLYDFQVKAACTLKAATMEEVWDAGDPEVLRLVDGSRVVAGRRY